MEIKFETREEAGRVLAKLDAKILLDGIATLKDYHDFRSMLSILGDSQCGWRGLQTAIIQRDYIENAWLLILPDPIHLGGDYKINPPNRTFNSKECADLVLLAMTENIEYQGKTSLVDYYKILGCEDYQESDDEWGWTDLREARIRENTIAGFTLLLPPIVRLHGPQNVKEEEYEYPKLEGLAVEFNNTGLEPILFVCKPTNKGLVYVSRCKGVEAIKIYNLLLGKKEGAK